jgi:hypothetical protein
VVKADWHFTAANVCVKLNRLNPSPEINRQWPLGFSLFVKNGGTWRPKYDTDT